MKRDIGWEIQQPIAGAEGGGGGRVHMNPSVGVSQSCETLCPEQSEY